MRLLTIVCLITSYTALSADWTYPTTRTPAQVLTTPPQRPQRSYGACKVTDERAHDLAFIVAHIVEYEVSGERAEAYQALGYRRLIRQSVGIACYDQIANGVMGRSPLTGE